MSVPASSRQTRVFSDRAEALGYFFHRAGEAPRVVAMDEEIGCSLMHVAAVLQWTTAVGVLLPNDLVHAARAGSETAAAVVERRREGRRIYVYLGPRMDAPPADPYEGTLLYDEPGVRAFEFTTRAHALAHFLRATLATGSVWSVLSRRAPELRHVHRWLSALLHEPIGRGSPHLVVGWFATAGAGVLLNPAVLGEPYVYEEVGIEE